jgi:NAD(P)-dependent dehydrogenase (short-subunit alcohol dehydrogenase family)
MVSKVAIVTGASSGLGLQIANDLLRKDYKVAICSRHRSNNHRFFENIVDITEESEVKLFVKKVMKEFGRIDVLVNNAGYAYPPEIITESKSEHLVNSFKTNVYGPYYLMREVVPIMKRQKDGKIINISSKAGVFGNPYMAVYSASKSALLKMTEAIAKEFRETKTNILCVVISPAGMNTKMRALVYGNEDAKKQMDVKFVSGIVTDIITSGSVPNSKYKNRKEKVLPGTNVIIKSGKTFIELMKDG